MGGLILPPPVVTESIAELCPKFPAALAAKEAVRTEAPVATVAAMPDSAIVPPLATRLPPNVNFAPPSPTAACAGIDAQNAFLVEIF